MKDLIYIVEDDTAIANVYAKSLLGAGYKTKIFLNAEDCLKTIKDGDWPDALICDYRLPKKNGLMCIKEVRELGVECPAIIITGARTKELVLESISIGVQAIIDKPCHLEEVIHQLKKVISHYKAINMANTLMNELQYFSRCSDQLMAAYNAKIKMTDEVFGPFKNPPLKWLIKDKEVEKWQKELRHAKILISSIKKDYEKITQENGVQMPFSSKTLDKPS